MKKAGLVEHSEEWYDYHDKRDLIGSIIAKSLQLEASQQNEAILAQGQEMLNTGTYFDGPIQQYMKNAHDIISNYNNNAVNHDIDQGLLYQEKRDATIDYILEDECRYNEFVENWVDSVV